MKTANILLEKRILANIIVHPDVWYEVAADFKPELFSDPEFLAIAQVMSDLGKQGKRPSTVALYKEFRKRGIETTPEELIEIVSGYVTAKETRSLLDELIDLYKRRTVYKSLVAALDNLKDEDKPTDELIAEAQQAMIEAFSLTGKSDLASMNEVCEELLVQQARLQEGEMPPIYPLSLAGVQTLLGGYETGSLNVIAARPSMGKTAFMLSECIGWAEKGLPGIIFSLEQKRGQIGQRSVANLENLPVNMLKYKLDPLHRNKFNAALSKLSSLPIKISDKRGLDADQICSIARVEKMRNPGLKWIAVDYLTAMSFDAKKQRQDLAVGEATLKLRNLAEELDVFVVLLSQLNRSVEQRDNKRPQKSDLRDSGNIEEYADSILFLYRHGYYKPGFIPGNEMADWVVEIEVAKNRQGGNDGKRTLALFAPATMHWKDCPAVLSEQYTRAVERERKKKGGAAIA